MAKFKDPAMPSIVSQADVAVKVASADPSFATSDVFTKCWALIAPQLHALKLTSDEVLH